MTTAIERVLTPTVLKVIQTILVVLVPWYVMLMIGMAFDTNLLGAWNWLVLIAIWAVGLVMVWRPGRTSN